MVFSGLTFLFLFLPVTLILYYIVPFRFKNAVLMVMSLIFYAWGEPIYVLLMIYSIVMNYAVGLMMDRESDHKKSILVFGIVLNLFILGFFKYFGFLVDNLNSLFGLNIHAKKLALPVGISFYTFQALSYIIDVYRGKVKSQKNIVNFATYITMFPQLIAGPIVRYGDICKEFDKRFITLYSFGRGALRFVFGLAKKVLLANLLGEMFEEIAAYGSGVSTVTAWLGAICYTLQIYFDFSGYSDMAIGLGRMMGFTICENFNYPYVSKTVTEFWRRWHMSLSGWFKEYVYIPLGGNRVSALKHVRNILIVWLLTGLWHGAAWNFVVWGLYYAALLLLEKYVTSKFKLPGWLTYIFTIVLVIIGWVIFSADSLGAAGVTVASMFGFAANGFVDKVGVYYLLTGGILIVIGVFFSMPVVGTIQKKLKKSMAGCTFLYIFAMALFVCCVIYLVTGNYNPFLYFRF
ncbi:MAG: MBOAT family protein [Lachnospiraceae bacterium]|nr:MBOAT family protein [Lachnospiraceae bacterium]